MTSLSESDDGDLDPPGSQRIFNQPLFEGDQALIQGV